MENSDQKIESALEEGAESIGLQENSTSVTQQKKQKTNESETSAVNSCI